MASPLVAQALPLTEDEISGAIFAKDGVYTPKAETRHRTIGSVVRDLSGFGLTYNHPISDTRTIWTAFTFRPSHALFLNHSSLKGSVSLDAKEGNLFSLMAGADQTFNPFKRRYWSFILGAGAGFQTSRYETVVNQQTCSGPKYCIIWDQKENSAQDNFGFLFWRFGVTASQFRIAGKKAGMVFAVMPLLVRWPKYLEISSDDYELRLGEKQSTFWIEFNLEI